MSERNTIFSLSTYEYLDELPESHQVLSENFRAPKETETSCVAQLPELISSVRDLVSALSSNPQTTDVGPDTLGVKEVSTKLGCSPGHVRKLVHQGKLANHWVGKNLRFRQQDLEEFWTSHTRLEADIKSSKKSPESCESNKMGSEGKIHNKKETSPIPTRREVDRLWQS